MFSHLPPLDFCNLERHSENIEDYADQHNPQFLVDISIQMNEQADRLEKMFTAIRAADDYKPIEYKDITAAIRSK